MLFDRTLTETYRNRTAVNSSIGCLIDAWTERSSDYRAAMLVAGGDIRRAAICGGEGWKQLADGDLIGALKVARERDPKTTAMHLLEAEGLITAGAIVAGLKHLEMLHNYGDVAAGILLARRRYTFGDYLGAERIAKKLPIHTQTALIGARAALMNEQTDTAFEFMAPFLDGFAPIPEPITAGAIGVITATILARSEEHDRLDRFACYLLDTPDLAEEMIPSLARIAWIAGLSSRAWNYFKGIENQWGAAGCLELAVLAGNISLALQLVKQAGPLSAPTKPAISLLGGGHAGKESEETKKLFADGAVIHLWRTHPQRWQPWIDAAMQTSAQVSVFDFAKDELPDPETIPTAVIDDCSLINMLSPVPVSVDLNQGVGVWLEGPLCDGIGIGHNWPGKETGAIKAQVPLASNPDNAAIWVLGADLAIKYVHSGHPMIVIAPPGDPFWAGALPERAWPAIHIIRADPIKGWEGAGTRVVEILKLMLNMV